MERLSLFSLISFSFRCAPNCGLVLLRLIFSQEKFLGMYKLRDERKVKFCIYRRSQDQCGCRKQEGKEE